jgi:electron transfer flavoprotein beta subunit
MSMNPFDEIAIEAAIQLKEQGLVSEIVVVTLGSPKAVDVLRQGLALGADRAVLVQVDQPLESLQIAKALAALAKRIAPDLILLGKQAIDNDCNQVGQMLAGCLGWPQGTFVSKIAWNENCWRVTREIDAGLEVLDIDAPAVVTTDLRLNTPRYPTLPNIMKSKSKPLETLRIEDLITLEAPQIERVSLGVPSERSGGVKVDSIEALMSILKDKEGVLP